MPTKQYRRCHVFFAGWLAVLLLAGPAAGAEKLVLGVVEAKKMVDRVRSSGGEVVIVDVRAGAEYEQAHIPDAVNVSMREEENLPAALESRGIPKDATLLIYSGSGTRSGRTVPVLRAGGYDKAFGLDQGLGAWEREGFPIERARPTAR